MKFLPEKLVREWSWRVNNGMPDYRNPLHLFKLKELLIERRFPYQFVDGLLNKKTKLILYGYDSFLFDFSKQDGVETLIEIKNILEEGKHYTKSKMGYNYGEMKDITKRL